MELTLCNSTVDASNKELNSQGNQFLPVAIYYEDIKTKSVPYHWHDEIEIIVVVKGVMKLIVETTSYTIKTGQGVFINSSRLHSCESIDHNECHIKSFVLNPRFLYGELSSILYENYFHKFLDPSANNTILFSDDSFSKLLDAFDTFKDQKYGYEFIVRDILTKLTLDLFSNLNTDNSCTDLKQLKQLKRLKAMMSYIHNNYQEEITLLDIALSANIKESEALRCFKNILRTSPIKYLKQYRINTAAYLLITTILPIIEIGLKCGFNEMSYFTKSFKEVYQLTPKEYRKVNSIKIYQ